MKSQDRHRASVTSSAVMTLLFRVFVPATIAGACGWLVAPVLVSNHSVNSEMGSAIGISAICIPVFVVSLLYGFHLKIVSIDSQVHVSHIRKTYSIDPKQIERCFTVFFLAGHPLCICFRKRYPFGKMVLFIPSRPLRVLFYRDSNREAIEYIMALRGQQGDGRIRREKEGTVES